MSHSNYVIEGIQEELLQTSRRSFMKRLAGGVAAAGLLGGTGLATATPFRELMDVANVMPADDMGDERFWVSVKGQFTLCEGLAVMNAANLCPSPYPVMETVFSRNVVAVHRENLVCRMVNATVLVM
mgnify:CR=1 FL=1